MLNWMYPCCCCCDPVSSTKGHDRERRDAEQATDIQTQDDREQEIRTAAELIAKGVRLSMAEVSGRIPEAEPVMRDTPIERQDCSINDNRPHR